MPTDPSPIGAAQVRIARPTKYLAAPKSLYVAVDAVGFGVLAQWVDHEGYDGVVLSIGDATRQLELLQQPGVTPTPTSEDQIVLYLGCTQTVAGMAEPIQAAGHQPVLSPGDREARTRSAPQAGCAAAARDPRVDRTGLATSGSVARSGDCVASRRARRPGSRTGGARWPIWVQRRALREDGRALRFADRDRPLAPGQRRAWRVRAGRAGLGGTPGRDLSGGSSIRGPNEGRDRPT